MDDLHCTVFPEIPDKNRPYKLLGLTSASYDFPGFAMLNPSLCDRIALMLYNAHVMDQKKVLNDFYKLCMYNFKNVAQSSSSETSINAWIKNAIFKLNRRQEVISSETVSTLHNQIVFAISQVVFDVLWDFLVDVGKKGLISGVVNARPKGQCSTKSNYLFPNMEMLLPNTTCSNSAPFLRLKENIKLSVSMNDPLHCLRSLWLEFCYHPDPTQNVKFIQHFQEEPDASSTQQSNDDRKSVNSTRKFTTNSTLSSSSSNLQSKAPNSISDDPKTSNLMLQSADDTKTTHTTTIMQNNHIMANAKSTQHSDDDQSTLSSESDSDSSGSWSCNDFNDSISDDDHLSSYTSNNKFLEKCNATIDWLQSTACDFDSDDDSLNFSQALTEENCMGSPSSRGSLNFVDCSDEEDDYEVIFFDGSSDTGFENDAFMDMSQGFENPCFEDSYRVFPAPSFIEMVNECWNDDMMELRDKPRKPSKVSFAPEPSLVTVQYFEKTDENTFDASLVLDNLRFRKRITELGHLLSPFLTIEHRMVVQRRNCFCELD